MSDKERSNKWRQNNPEKTKEYSRIYYINHKEEKKEKTRIYRMNNIEKIKLLNKKRYDKNIIKIKKRRNILRKLKCKTNLKYNLSRKVSSTMYKSLKRNKNHKHWESLVDYDINTLLKHLKKTIPNGYTWQDYIKGKLQIDHIIPISVFNYTKPEHIDFKRCWALKNLRLLPAKENIIKSNKLYKPFQPALKIIFSS